MDFAEVVRRRRMTRAYTADAVDPAIVERALDHATRAPSAGFSQGWAFVVLDEPDQVRGFWEAQADTTSASPWLAGMMSAPVVVVPCSRRSVYLDRYAEPDKARAGLGDRDRTKWAMPYWDLDTAMASLLILQSVTDAGLGCCFFGLVPGRVELVKAQLGLVDTDDEEAPHPIGAITIGHPAEAGQGTRGSASRRERKPWADVAHRGRYGAGWGA